MLPISFISLPYICVCFVHCEDEPGKQVKSAIRLKNTSRSHVAFKVCGFFSVRSCLFLKSFHSLHGLLH